MKVTYIRLENVAGLKVGSDINKIEIDLTKAKNKIISIQAPNGYGKSVLLSSIHPFSGVTSIDNRSSLSYIIPKKDGYKEIHYQNGEDYYIIKHYYKATKDSHSVKSYISKNGVELNENGNVRSFIALVEINLGLTEDMMRLLRLGTNVGSFITLTPARRKEYIGKLIEDINLYLMIYKEKNDDLRVVRTLMNTNANNLYNCHISDLIIEEDKLKRLGEQISDREKEKEKILGKIGRVKALMKDNDINDLRKKKQEAEASLSDIAMTEQKISSMGLEGVTVEQLIIRRSNLSDQKIEVQSKINSYRILIDNTLRNIEKLEINIKKITSNNDIESLINAIEDIKVRIESSKRLLAGFSPLGSTSNDIYGIISKLNSFNQISQMIQTFGNRPIEVYLKLRDQGSSVDKFLKDQMKKSLSNINKDDIRLLLDKLFQNDGIIYPNCSTEYEDCPYYRFSEVINEVKDKLEEESFDDETLRYIQVISNNIDNIMNEIDRMDYIQLPDNLKHELKEKRILQRMRDKLPFFDVSGFNDYLSIVKEYELYQRDVAKKKDYEQQLSIYKKSGIDGQLTEIEDLKKQIDFYRNNINTLSSDITEIDDNLSLVDKQITLVTKYNDGKKYKKIFKSTLESTEKLLGPLESASQEKMELEFQLRQVENIINMDRDAHKQLEQKINEYKRLVEEGKMLSKKHKDLTRILESTSTKEGMPVVHMKKYLGSIKKLANTLLKLIYDDKFKLAKFEITQDTFEVPYLKNGHRVSDVKYASQSELALSTIALSFALSNKASGDYNILLLDEIDSGLDEASRPLFLKMLYMQMSALHSEQVFLISQNISQMINIPMDVIKLADIGVRSKLQNIIYE